MKLEKNDALIVVDVQRDFIDGGALEVRGSIKIIPMINRYVEFFTSCGAKIIASRDWHPPNHSSFKPYGGPWPVHCVRDTEGAEFHPNLRLPNDAIIISKATKPEQEAYSAFQGTDLKERLKKFGIRRVFICGVATEYCVKSTALDAVSLGFETFLLLDAIKGLGEESSQKAIREMIERGVRVIKLEDLNC